MSRLGLPPSGAVFSHPTTQIGTAEECQSLCSTTPECHFWGFSTRDDYCKGYGNVPLTAVPSSGKDRSGPSSCFCADQPPQWVDVVGASCADYVAHNWCDASGAYGLQWSQTAFGTFADYRDNIYGMDATEACCGCGGGAPTEKVLCAYPAV